MRRNVRWLVRGYCRFSGFTTTAYPLRVLRPTTLIRASRNQNWILSFRRGDTSILLKKCEELTRKRPNYHISLNRTPAIGRFVSNRGIQVKMTNVTTGNTAMPQFNIAKARTRFSEIVQKAMLGEEVVPLSAPSHNRKPGSARGQILHLADDFDDRIYH
jgi:hypothetical protein